MIKAEWTNADALNLQPTCNQLATDCISRQTAIDDIKAMYEWHDVVTEDRLIEHMKRLPSAQPEIAENLYMYKCYITDKDGLQHEVIHTDDIRRVTGWEI